LLEHNVILILAALDVQIYEKYFLQKLIPALHYNLFSFPKLKRIFISIRAIAAAKGLLLSGNKSNKNARRAIVRRPARFQELNQKNSPAAQTAFDFKLFSNGRCPPATIKARRPHEEIL